MAELREIVHGRGLHVVIFGEGSLRITVMRDVDANKQPAVYIKMPYAIRPTEVEQFNLALTRARQIAEGWAADAQSEEAE